MMKKRQPKIISHSQSPQNELVDSKSDSQSRSGKKSQENSMIRSQPEFKKLGEGPEWAERQKEKMGLEECKIFDDQISSINGDQESELGKTLISKFEI
jgi:hypothetical protein